MNDLVANRQSFLTAEFPAGDWKRIDGVCAQFEHTWRGGKQPAIEGYLDGFSGRLRSALFAELLVLDIEYRMNAGQPVARTDYETRFPDETKAIESVFSDDSSVLHTQNPVDELIPPLENLSLASQFHLRQFHARGGLGVIYVAHDQRLGRDVAVKFSRRRLLNSPEQARLTREAEITGRLEHPGIVPVYATGEMPNGLPCYVMKLIDGSTLQEAIDSFHETGKKGSLDPYQRLEFRQLIQRFIAVCNTVDYAHSQKVIHRDIKPGNIMLGSFGETYLLDWGLAKVIADPEVSQDADSQTATLANPHCDTCTGQIMGTPAFASPEQISGQIDKHDARTDIYLLGATLYCILAGQYPRETVRDNASKSNESETVSPRHLDRRIPASMEAICLKAMARDPQSRYPSAQCLANDLERYLADEPVSVIRDPWRSRVRRLGRRHPRVVSGIAASLGVGIMALAVGSWLLGNKNRELSSLNVSIDHKNVELQQSNQELFVAKNNAEEARNRTVAAFRTITDHVINRIATKRSELTVTEREFVENGLEQYKALTRLPGNDLDTMVLKVEAHYRVGKVYQILGRFDEAAESYEVALQLGSPLLANTTSSELADFIARTHGDYGFLLSNLGHSAKADHHISIADEMFADLAVRFPDEPLYRNWANSSLLYRSRQLTKDGQTKASIGELKNAVLMASHLSAEYPRHIEYRRNMAVCRNNLGLALNSAGSHEAARKELETAIGIQRALASKYTDSIIYRSDLSSSLINLCKAFLGLGWHDRALETSEEAILIAKELIDTEPANHRFYERLAFAHAARGDVYHVLRQAAKGDDDLALRHAEAGRNAFEQAIQYARVADERSPSELDDASAWMLTARAYGKFLITCGQLKDARTVYDQCLQVALKNYRRDAHGYRVQLSDIYSLLADVALRSEESDSALKLQRKALELFLDLPESEVSRPVVRRAYRESAWNYAWRLMQSGHQAEAIEYWDLVIELGRPDSRELKAQTIRAVCYAYTDQQRALESVDAILQQGLERADQYYNLACACALASKSLEPGPERDSAIAKAFEMLDCAKREDYFDDPARVARLKRSGPFSELRNTTQFREFLTEIEPAVSNF